MTRTFSRDDFFRAKREWEDFGSDWWPFKRLAADRGFIFPPTGTKHDDRDAESPSQRAIVWRAIEDQPTELRRIISRSWSWSQVVDQIIGLETRLRMDADDRARDEEWDREHRADHRQSVMALKAIINRISDS